MQQKESKHWQYMTEYEKLRHKHIMEEIKALKDAKIKEYNRGSVTKIKVKPD
jgi:hypothetical protein